MKKLFKDISFWILVLIIGAGIILRFSYLNRVPAGISDDELDYVLTARSVYYSGRTLEGLFSPFSFQTVPPNILAPYARAPYMILAPFAGMFQHGLGETKIPYAVISILATVVLVCISWILWGKRIAIFTAFVSSFNPWSVYFGRTAFDTPLSVFFIYIFLLALLSLRNWWLLLAYIPWFIGLYSYQGMIIVYPLILAAAIFGTWKLRGRVYGRPYLVLAALGIVTFSLFLVSFRGDRAGTRMNEIATPDNPSIIAGVDIQRRLAVQTPFNAIVLNKVTVAGWQILGQYIGAFSTQHLFVSGEQRSTFSLWSHGLFYSIDALFLLIGLYSAYRMNRKKTWFLFALILIAPIPAAISTAGVSYALRASFMYPLFCIFIAMGIAWICRARRFSVLISLGLIVLYTVVITNFMHIYFIRNPVSNSEGFGFSNRVLAKYIKLAADANVNVLYIGNNVLNTYRQYIFYTDFMTQKSIAPIQQSVRARDYAVGTIRFIECPTGESDAVVNGTVITPYGKTCPSLTAYKKSSDPVAIAQLSDSGRMFEIYNDNVCSKYPLSEYQPMISFGDLDVEAIAAEKFCKTYISKPRPDRSTDKSI